ncbi:MAG: type IV pili twitching motility protein PilT, partial [Candidatus Omnitrophota bacterium]
AAETGHLVLSTLQTSDTVSSLSRITDVFPAAQQQQIRMFLAENLQGVISQLLIPRQDKQERIVATEVLVGTPAVSNLIRHGNFQQISVAIETGARYGMHLMDTSIERLCQEGIISREKAALYAKDPTKFI